MHILLVEDNSTDAALLTELLAEREKSVHVHWVTDGNKALDYIYQREPHKFATRPDAILLDLGLPRISGYEVLKELKNNPIYQSIPVIILSTSCNPLDTSQCRALGADKFLSKPHNLKGYEELVRQLLEIELPRLPKAI